MNFVERYQMGANQQNAVLLCKMKNSCEYSSAYLNKEFFNAYISLDLYIMLDLLYSRR